MRGWRCLARGLAEAWGMKREACGLRWEAQICGLARTRPHERLEMDKAIITVPGGHAWIRTMRPLPMEPLWARSPFLFSLGIRICSEFRILSEGLDGLSCDR